MAALNLNTIRAAIEGRLSTELAGSPVIPVVFHNMSYTPTPADSWVQCLVSFGNSSYETMGDSSSSSNLVFGVVLINIFTAQGIGPG